MEKLDSISDSISRASGIHCRAKETFALYFAVGRIASVVESSPHFIARVGMTCKHVVGVYERTVDFRMIIEDIRFFYAEANKTKNAEYQNLINRELRNAKEKSMCED
jgi:hypothetical protein